jgi:tetratricopeptide (TPR) repeat protein
MSYRRDDSVGNAGRIRDRLTQYFGANQLFQDFDAIEAGENFPIAINSALSVCEVQLVIIGPGWLDSARNGGRRLDDPDDWVRKEVEAALDDPDVRVIPVLVSGAVLPHVADLPEPLQRLTLLQAVSLRGDRFDDDLDQLIGSIGGPGRTWIGLPRPVWPVLGVVALLSFAAFSLWPRSAATMSGDFRIAVAGFTEEDRSSSDRASELSGTVHRGLSTEISQLNDQGFNFGLWGPDRAGLVSDDADAEALAERIDADVVIYGSLEGSQLRPAFYLRQRPPQPGSVGNFLNAEELLGQYSFGSSILMTGGLGQNADATQQLRARTAALAQFVIGLSYYAADPPAVDQAASRFQAALETDGWADGDGKEVLYLFLGNVAGLRGNLDSAAENYRRSFESSGEGYARALVGLAEVSYQQGRQQCSENAVDRQRLESSLRLYSQALTLDAPSLADIDVKVALGRGRVYRCLSQSLIEDDWNQAANELRFVISAFEGGNLRVRELASIAHGELALVVAPESPTADGARESYEEAIVETKAAIGLTGFDERKALYLGRLAFFYRRLGLEDEALRVEEQSGRLLVPVATAASTSRIVPSPSPSPSPATETPASPPALTPTAPTEKATLVSTPTGSASPTRQPPRAPQTVDPAAAVSPPLSGSEITVPGAFSSRDIPPPDIEAEVVPFAPGVGTGLCGGDAPPEVSVTGLTYQRFQQIPIVNCTEIPSDRLTVAAALAPLGEEQPWTLSLAPQTACYLRPLDTTVLAPGGCVLFLADESVPLGAYRVTFSQADLVVAEGVLQIDPNVPTVFLSGGSIATQILGKVRVSLRGFAPGPVGLSVEEVGGGTLLEATVDEPRTLTNEIEFSFVLKPFWPVGEYRVSAKQANQIFFARLTVETPSRPRIGALLPLEGTPGTVFSLGMAGFEPYESIDVAVFRGSEDGHAAESQYALIGVTEFSVTVDGTGSAVLSLPSEQSTAPGWYCFVPRSQGDACGFERDGTPNYLGMIKIVQ